MQAAYLKNGNLSIINDYPMPKRRPDEALIRVRLAGICSTDLEMVKGYKNGYTGILGHEFVGEVVEAADAQWIGQRVVGSINIGCHDCTVCHTTGPEHCPTRRVLGMIDWDGAFAEYITLPIRNLHPVPDGMANETAVFTEPLAAALRICKQIKLLPSAKTAVVGPGRLGLLVGLAMANASLDVTMLGRRASSLELPTQLGLKTGLTNAFQDNEFDVVVETTGNDAGFAQALRLIRPLGTLILKSTFQGNSKLDLTKLVVAEISVIGSRCGPFAPALQLLAEGLNVQPLINGNYPLTEAVTAFNHAGQQGIRKILLRP